MVEAQPSGDLLTFPLREPERRPALRAAADQIDRFDDGVFFVDLSTTRDTESVLTAIPRAIGLSGTSEKSLLEELKRQLREQQMLLVLDNFEQVTVAALTPAPRPGQTSCFAH